MLLYNR